MKTFSKILLALYLLALLWLVLFKFSFDIPSVILHHQARSLNLIPFAGHGREMLDNFIVFVPFGLLLSVNFKQINLWRKLVYIAAFSVGVEIIQFILAIGVTDITDVITNTLGGLFGLLFYALCGKFIANEKQDRIIAITCAILIGLVMYLRFFVFKVRY